MAFLGIRNSVLVPILRRVSAPKPERSSRPELSSGQNEVTDVYMARTTGHLEI